jgi:Ni/Fe-hydrogenase 1 B-type cytochrome subunit
MELKAYRVWDASTRWFHWINALCVIALMTVGVIILNASGLGIQNPGKVTLKTLHVLIGYIFTLNILWRVVWGFVGNPYARWKAFLPGGAGYSKAVRSYIAAFLSGHPEPYLGHNPLARLGVSALFLLILIQALTGLILAGTDLFYPPIGGWVARWVAASGVDPTTLVPYAPPMYDQAAYASMRAFRAPIATTHLFGFYVLMFVLVAHITAVVITEIREGGSIVSAMFTGRKIMSGRPLDMPEKESRTDDRP